MSEFWSPVAGIALLVLLLVVAMKGWLASRRRREALLEGREEDVSDPCPNEFVESVFSRTDWEFVLGLQNDEIKRLFKKERKKTALIWVCEISAGIRGVMREHAEAARRSKNLRASTEVSLFAQFLSLVAVCGILRIAIRIGGPVRLGALAHLAQSGSQQLSHLQDSFQAGGWVKARGSGAA